MYKQWFQTLSDQKVSQNVLNTRKQKSLSPEEVSIAT